MMSTNNVLSPANGEPVIVPTQDVVLGLYYLTRTRVNARGEGMHFADVEEVHRAYESGSVDLHAKIKQEFGKLDAVLHAVAFAKKDDLEGCYLNTSRDGFLLALEVFGFTFVTACRHAAPLMGDGGSLMTLTYLGGQKVVPNYNMMGVAKAALEASMRYLAFDLGPKNIRVNAISPGPTMTLSARGISGFTELHKLASLKVPLKRNTNIEEVGDTVAFMASDFARGITGEILYVDGGGQTLASF